MSLIEWILHIELMSSDVHSSWFLLKFFFRFRLPHLMGYEKKDLINHVPFEFHHHEDVEANLECSRGCKYLKTLRVCVC